MITGPSEEECWKAMQQPAGMVNSLGIHEAVRKRQWGTCRPGTWVGSVMEATDKGVYVPVSHKKREKSQRYIGDIIEELKGSGEMVSFKSLVEKHGFLMHVTRTYPVHGPVSKRNPSNFG
jgi:hypothetical protein